MAGAGVSACVALVGIVFAAVAAGDDVVAAAAAPCSFQKARRRLSHRQNPGIDPASRGILGRATV